MAETAASIAIRHSLSGRAMRCSVEAYETVYKLQGWVKVPDSEMPPKKAAKSAKPETPESAKVDEVLPKEPPKPGSKKPAKKKAKS